MSATTHPHAGKFGFVLFTSLLGVLAGCVTHVDGPRHPRGQAPPPTVYQEVVQDDYVYYPGYEVYYSSHRRQYIYRDGRSWVSRSAPPRVSADVLFASPSVRLDFHDAPSIHHERVVRQYPRDWVPPGPGYHRGNEYRDDGRDNYRGGRR